MTNPSTENDPVAFMPAWAARLTRRSEAEARRLSSHDMPLEVENCALWKNDRSAEE
jgi:hypothetical protein